MALVVEDGSGRADSESYASVAFAQRYHNARGNEAWDDLDDPEAALRKATDYMLQAYRGAWAGQRMSTTQALDWPRWNVPMRDVSCAYYPTDSVPWEVQKACAELALRVGSGELMPDVGPQVQSNTVGPITVTYAPWMREHTVYRAIDAILAPLLGASGNSARVVRV